LQEIYVNYFVVFIFLDSGCKKLGSGEMASPKGKGQGAKGKGEMERWGSVGSVGGKISSTSSHTSHTSHTPRLPMPH